MSIRVDAYTRWGMASGTLVPPDTLHDALESGGALPLERVSWQGIDDAAPQVTATMTIPADDVLLVVADDDPGIPVHAAWHRIHVESGPYTIEGELATLPGFDPGRALTRPSGEFLMLRDIRLSVSARPEGGVSLGDHALINRLTVERIRSELMLGFFFPGAAVDPIGTAGGLA